MKTFVVAIALTFAFAGAANAVGGWPPFPRIGQAKIAACGPPGCCAKHACLGERDPTCQNGCCTCTVR